jgi:hypothetical protein
MIYKDLQQRVGRISRSMEQRCKGDDEKTAVGIHKDQWEDCEESVVDSSARRENEMKTSKKENYNVCIQMYTY